MGVIDEPTREYLDKHFSRLYDEIKALRKDDYDHAISLAKIFTIQRSHAEELKELKSRQWHGVGALITALATALWTLFTSGKH